jgi:hypothetical protein
LSEAIIAACSTSTTIGGRLPGTSAVGTAPATARIVLVAAARTSTIRPRSTAATAWARPRATATDATITARSHKIANANRASRCTVERV